MLLTLSSAHPTPSTLVSLLLELDIHLPADRNALVVDHFNYDTLSSPEQHDVVLVPRPDTIRPDVKNFFRGDGKGGEVIAFPRGVGQTLGNASPLLTPILRAPRSAYSYNPKDDVEGAEDTFAVGQQLSLITAMQARNSARFTVIGSAEMLENTWFDSKVKRSAGLSGKGEKDAKTSNQAFVNEVTGWTFKEIGVLKVGKIEHRLNEGGVQSNITNPKIYRVKNDVVCNVQVTSTSLANWIPSHTKSSSPNTSGTTGHRSPHQLATSSNSNSPCSHPSTASPSSQKPPLKTPPSTPPASNSPTNTVSSISWSITSDHSSLTLKRRILLL
jgi:oligosaccharyltransferase complex subunit beta